MADRGLLARLLAGGEEEDVPPRHHRGLFGARIDPRVSARLAGDFSTGASQGLQQASQDFQGGFGGMAAQTRQALPYSTVNALDQSGVPGWHGMAQQRSQMSAQQAGLSAPVPISPAGVPLSNLIDVVQPGARSPVRIPSPQRNTQPVQGPRETDLENEAWTAALERTRSRMRFEGERERQRLPRPGQPLIAQAWADQGGLMGGLAGVEGDRLNPNRGNSRDRR